MSTRCPTPGSVRMLRAGCAVLTGPDSAVPGAACALRCRGREPRGCAGTWACAAKPAPSDLLPTSACLSPRAVQLRKLKMVLRLSRLHSGWLQTAQPCTWHVPTLYLARRTDGHAGAVLPEHVPRERVAAGPVRYGAVLRALVHAARAYLQPGAPWGVYVCAPKAAATFLPLRRG